MKSYVKLDSDLQEYYKKSLSLLLRLYNSEPRQTGKGIIKREVLILFGRLGSPVEKNTWAVISEWPGFESQLCKDCVIMDDDFTSLSSTQSPVKYGCCCIPGRDVVGIQWVKTGSILRWCLRPSGHGNNNSHRKAYRNREGGRQEAFNALLWDVMTPVGLILMLPEWCDSCWGNGLGRCHADLMTGHSHPVTLSAKMGCARSSLHSLADCSAWTPQWNLALLASWKNEHGCLAVVTFLERQPLFGPGIQPPLQSPPLSSLVQASSFPCFIGQNLSLPLGDIFVCSEEGESTGNKNEEMGPLFFPCQGPQEVRFVVGSDHVAVVFLIRSPIKARIMGNFRSWNLIIMGCIKFPLLCSYPSIPHHPQPLAKQRAGPVHIFGWADWCVLLKTSPGDVQMGGWAVMVGSIQSSLGLCLASPLTSSMTLSLWGPVVIK